MTCREYFTLTCSLKKILGNDNIQNEAHYIASNSNISAESQKHSLEITGAV